jgi:2-keto-3-deoxy-L-rhamnonate aldolase RhmA
MSYRLLENMEQKKLSMGMLTKGASPQMVRHIYAAGLDFLIVDMMHAKVGWDEAAQLCWVARADGLYPFIRIPSHPWGTGTQYVNQQFAVDAIRALSTCSEGVMWSISKFEEAELVSHMASDWHQGIPVTSSKQVEQVQSGGNKRRLLIPLIETLGALEQLDPILSLSGISGVFIACTDLSHQLGHPHDYQHPKVEEALRESCRLAHSKDKVVVANTGYIFPTVEGQIEHANWLADCGVDLVMLQTTEYYIYVLSKVVSEGVRAKREA